MQLLAAISAAADAEKNCGRYLRRTRLTARTRISQFPAKGSALTSRRQVDIESRSHVARRIIEIAREPRNRETASVERTEGERYRESFPSALILKPLAKLPHHRGNSFMDRDHRSLALLLNRRRRSARKYRHAPGFRIRRCSYRVQHLEQKFIARGTGASHKWGKETQIDEEQ